MGRSTEQILLKRRKGLRGTVQLIKCLEPMQNIQAQWCRAGKVDTGRSLGLAGQLAYSTW